MRWKSKGRWCPPKIYPLVPSKLTDFWDVTFFAKSGIVRRVASQLKNVFVSHVGYGGSLFSTIVPEDHRRLFIVNVFAYRFLKQTNMQFCPICPMCLTLQNSKFRANFMTKLLNFLRFVTLVWVSNDCYRYTDLFWKLLERFRKFADAFHCININITFVRHKYLHAGVTPINSCLLRDKECVSEEVWLDSPIA